MPTQTPTSYLQVLSSSRIVPFSTNAAQYGVYDPESVAQNLEKSERLVDLGYKAIALNHSSKLEHELNKHQKLLESAKDSFDRYKSGCQRHIDLYAASFELTESDHQKLQKLWQDYTHNANALFKNIGRRSRLAQFSFTLSDQTGISHEAIYLNSLIRAVLLHPQTTAFGLIAGTTTIAMGAAYLYQ